MISNESKIDEEKVENRWQYQPLTLAEVKKIHETSMQVLEEIGFEVQGSEALELFKKAGAQVDHEKRIVRLKETQIKKIISTVPSQITLYGREPKKHNLTLGADNVYFGTGGTALNMLDYDTGIHRPANIQDLLDIIRIVNKLENIHLMLLPTYPSDLAIEDVDVNRFLAGMMYTSKHVMGGIYTSQGIDDVIAMAEKVVGSAKALRARPFISMIACGISPLRIDNKYGGFIIQIARQGIPLAVPVEPLCGATAPVTLAGTLVIQNCDGLIHMMLTQLAKPGAPAIYGCVATSVNLHDIKYLGGPVESGILNAATAQLAKYYGFPYYSTAGISDSKTLDTQCGYETAINNLLVALAGGDFIHDAAGLMEFATTVSKEKLVIDNEILGMVRRAVKGIDVNKDTLAFEVIRKVGPGGNFVANRHTRKYMYKEHYIPTLCNRENREVWDSKGRTTTAEEASKRVKEILSEHPSRYINDELLRSLINSFPNIEINRFQKNI
jgi:trimethylamine--corrinoid protein Co-methyltransferase